MAEWRLFPAVRVPVGDEDKSHFQLEPGEYMGPFEQAGKNVVWFCPPEDSGATRSKGHVSDDIWSFRECADGSLEIRESIAWLNGDGSHSWHGYLDEGNQWRVEVLH